jgi:hypothetical protein
MDELSWEYMKEPTAVSVVTKAMVSTSYQRKGEARRGGNAKASIPLNPSASTNEIEGFRTSHHAELHYPVDG